MSIYDYTVKAKDGTEVSMKDYEGKVVDRFAPTTTPEALDKEIAKLL